MKNASRGRGRYTLRMVIDDDRLYQGRAVVGAVRAAEGRLLLRGTEDEIEKVWLQWSLDCMTA